MCGIAGIVSFDPRDRVDERRLTTMRDVMRHRGPDGEGLFLDGPVGLAHRRLSIVDVSAGHQPMSNEDGSDLGRLQRRNLQPRRPAAAAGTARPSLPHAIGHRNDPASVRREGRRRRGRPPRHVRVRDLGSHAPAVAARPRSARHQAALLHADRNRVAVRLGNQRRCSPLFACARHSTTKRFLNFWPRGFFRAKKRSSAISGS